MMFLMSAIDKDVVMRTLNILWQGLLSVFLVILVIVLLVVVLNFISARSAKYRQEHAGEPTVSDKVKEKWENHVRVREDKKAAKLLAKEEKKQEKLAQKQQDEQNKQD